MQIAAPAAAGRLAATTRRRGFRRGSRRQRGAALLGVSAAGASTIWTVILFVYVFIASTIPVWSMLQPRDYLNSYLLYAMVLMGFVGIVIARPGLELPAFTGWSGAMTNGTFASPHEVPFDVQTGQQLEVIARDPMDSGSTQVARSSWLTEPLPTPTPTVTPPPAPTAVPEVSPKLPKTIVCTLVAVPQSFGILLSLR